MWRPPLRREALPCSPLLSQGGNGWPSAGVGSALRSARLRGATPPWRRGLLRPQVAQRSAVVDGPHQRPGGLAARVIHEVAHNFYAGLVERFTRTYGPAVRTARGADPHQALERLVSRWAGARSG